MHNKFNFSQAEIILGGIVQGVGFRPFVKRTAIQFNINGFVENREFGVRIVAVQQRKIINNFYRALLKNKPDVSAIIEHSIKFQNEVDFEKNKFFIARSQKKGEISALLPPDIATCDECLKELQNPDDRHYHYPFINCTNCGPRFSIIKKLPYDRKNTTMKKFEMCEECYDEYTTVADRRFHAQPNACPVCGPEVEFVKIEKGIPKSKFKREKAIEETIALLQSGKIVAIKGLGGFHIACDANNTSTVNKLRRLKNRPKKPFALMADSLETISKYCHISEKEKQMLTKQQKPIVLLKVKKEIEAIAPEINRLGFMLPYTPLHFLLLKELELLVMTSGNISGAALEKDNEQAFANLQKFTDNFLVYNRIIHNRVDDSIIKFSKFSKILIRKARGFTPLPIRLPEHKNGKHYFAAGADMKGTFGLAKNNIFLGSQYFGDLQYSSNLKFYRNTLDYFLHVFDFQPDVVIADSHLNYYSTQLAVEYAQKNNLPIHFMQHHNAHLFSVMAEHNLEKAIGVSFDGTGLGDDQQIWGGEFFTVRNGKTLRRAHLKYQPLISGDVTAKEPWRMALVYLFDSVPDKIDDIIPADKFKKRDVILSLLKNNIDQIKTSSMGRLFDAITSIISVCHYNTYQAEAPIKLESLATNLSATPYAWQLDKSASPWLIDLRETITQIVNDIENHISKNEIASKFHKTLAEIVFVLSKILFGDTGIRKVVCSGGVFQNGVLVDMIFDKFTDSALDVYFNEKVPSNDAGMALGQIYGYFYLNKFKHK
ncbi:MAG: carbamoyltransferase HypF [Candidatus Cloacimonetes bacterium]|nr:carbamoyltransferase HypF [Candidatus Cloacimonadota bacterium]